jgi:hypothetical protein
MTTVTAHLNNALITMAQRGDGHDALIRSQEMWTSEDPHDRDMSS